MVVKFATENNSVGGSDIDIERGELNLLSGLIRPKTVGRVNSVHFGSSTSPKEKEEDSYVEGDEFQSQDLEINLQRILDSLCPHVSFRVKEGYEMENLPKFDDLTRYDIREEQEHKLWRLEVERLAHSAQSSSPPGLEGNPEWFGNADSDGYNRLHRLALQVQYALLICIHDNELVLLEHHPQMANDKTYKMAHERIHRTYDQEKGCIRYERPIRIDRYNDEALHALINYITAVMIRMLVRSMKGRLWIDNCISVFAKFAAKFKVICADLPKAFERTFEAYRDFQVRVSPNPEAQGLVNTAQSNSSRSDDDPLAKQQVALQEDIDTSGARYFMEMDTFRHSMGGLVQPAFQLTLRTTCLGRRG